jgi:hypothetical protein
VNLEMEATQQDITQQEREKASHYLGETQHALLRETDRLSEAQWNFQPAPDRWSIAEILEHVAIVSHRVEEILARLPQAPAPASDRDQKAIDEAIVKATETVITKFQAPSIIAPTGRWLPASSIDHLRDSCAATDALLQSASDLRGHVISHPVVGPLDGYQWILIAAAHLARHTKQILEVKADTKFPAH